MSADPLSALKQLQDTIAEMTHMTNMVEIPAKIRPELAWAIALVQGVLHIMHAPADLLYAVCMQIVGVGTGEMINRKQCGELVDHADTKNCAAQIANLLETYSDEYAGEKETQDVALGYTDELAGAAFAYISLLPFLENTQGNTPEYNFFISSIHCIIREKTKHWANNVEVLLESYIAGEMVPGDKRDNMFAYFDSRWERVSNITSKYFEMQEEFKKIEAETDSEIFKKITEWTEIGLFKDQL